jgi:hypothetical protein
MMNQLRSRTTALLLLPAMTVLALALGTSTSAVAQKSVSPKAAAADAYTYVPFAGQSVAIDRQTGKLRPPTPDEARQLGAALKNFLNRSDQGLTITTHANGVQSVDLQGRFQSVSLAKINPDGSASEKCVTSMSEAQAFLMPAPAKQKSAASPATGKKANRSAEEE